MNEKAEFKKQFNSILPGLHAWDVWSDWLILASSCIRNCPTLGICEQTESEYMKVAGKYTKEKLDTMANLLAITAVALERPHDFLGTIFHEMELHNSAHGQFFTPYDLCKMMAWQILHEGAPHDGTVKIHEPACGSGAMVIAFHEVAYSQGWAHRTYYELQDLDDRAFRMAYIQCSLLGLSAIVKRGNTLSMKFDRAWPTPTYIINEYNNKMEANNEDAEPSIEGPTIAVPTCQPAVEEAIMQFDLFAPAGFA
jgi:hypothetical protein